MFQLLYFTPAHTSFGVFTAANAIHHKNMTYFWPYWLLTYLLFVLPNSFPFPVRRRMTLLRAGRKTKMNKTVVVGAWFIGPIDPIYFQTQRKVPNGADNV
jgi:hypothetical protein